MDAKLNIVDPRYGIPKRQKFVAFRDGGTPRTSPNAARTSPLAQQLVKMHERKYFDSADWVLKKEVAPVHPKVFTEEDGDKKENIKTVEEHNIERGKRYFDSADWAVEGKKYAQARRPAHPSLLKNESPADVDYSGVTRHICQTHLKPKRAYFDSADWALHGKATKLHHPSLGFDKRH